MNIVEFALKMKDSASPVLDGVGRKWMEVQENCARAKREMEDYGSRTKGMAEKLTGLLKGVGIAMAAQKAGEFIAGTMQSAMERQKLQVSFDVMTGSKEAGSKLTKELVDLQKNTILGGEVFEGAQTMLGFGVSAEGLTDTLRRLGDVSMGNAERFKSLSLVFGQIRSKGKLMGDDLRQMSEVGFNPLKVLSEMTGKSMEQMYDEMAKGAVTAEMVDAALRQATDEGGKFNNMLGQMAEKSAGKWAQLQGAWGETKVKIGEAMEPLLRFGVNAAGRLLPVIEAIAAKAGSIAEMIVGKIGEMKERFAGLTDYLTMQGEYVMGSLVPAVKRLWALVSGVVGDIVEFVSTSELLKDVFAVVLHTAGKVVSIVKWLIEALKDTWDNVIKPIIDGIEKAYRFVKELAGGKVRESAVAVKTLKTVPVPKETAGGTQETLKEIARNTKENAVRATARNGEVASSGPKVVNVNVQKFFDNIEFNTTNIEESVGKIEETVLEVLSRVLVQGATQSI